FSIPRIRQTDPHSKCLDPRALRLKCERTRPCRRPQVEDCVSIWPRGYDPQQSRCRHKKEPQAGYARWGLGSLLPHLGFWGLGGVVGDGCRPAWPNGRLVATCPADSTALVPQQLRQLRDIYRNSPSLVFRE